MVEGLWFPNTPIDWHPLTPADVPQCLICERQCKRSAARQYLRYRQAALHDLESFRQFVNPSMHPDFAYPPADHHKVLQEHLTALVHDDIRRLMIFCPPGAAKSTYASIQAPAYYLAKHPDRTILGCSNTQDLAETFNRRRRNVIETPEWQELSGTRLDPKNQGVKEFGLVGGGLCVAAGQGGSITGRRSDFNVADDLIVGHEQANSPTQLDKMWQWWNTEFANRLKPRRPELVIMTRWSAGDIAGRLLNDSDAQSWTVLRMPMECDDPANDPMGRKEGERLWPEWFEKEKVEKLKGNPRDWISLYQQRPVDEKGSWCPPEHINIVPAHKQPKRLNYMIGVDIALTANGGDFTVFAVIGIDADRKMHLVDLYREQVTPDVSSAKFLDLCEEYRPLRAYCDDDNASKVWKDYVFDQGRRRGYMPPLQLIPTRGRDKETRASTLRGYLVSDSVTIREAPWAPDVYEEFMGFPGAVTHDDIVDAVAVVARQMKVAGAPSAPPKEQKKPIDTGVIEKDGVLHLNTPLEDLKPLSAGGSSIRRLYNKGWQ